MSEDMREHLRATAACFEQAMAAVLNSKVRLVFTKCVNKLLGDAWKAMRGSSHVQDLILSDPKVVEKAIDKQDGLVAALKLLLQSDPLNDMSGDAQKILQCDLVSAPTWPHHAPLDVASSFLSLLDSSEEPHSH